MRFVVLLAVLVGVIACSSTKVDAPAPIDAGEETTIPEECAITPLHFDEVASADCDPCRLPDLVEGASCGAASVGVECEKGDHCAWECNEVWVCDATQHWTKVSSARSVQTASARVTSSPAPRARSRRWRGCPATTCRSET
ncbi:hypothetical protein BH09MYX1_BH09MYX1_26220 [soil metagenome]